MSTRHRTSDHKQKYYNIHQLRADKWTALKRMAHHLSKDRKKDKDRESHAKADGLLKEIKEIEYYFAFPGNDFIGVLQHHLKHDEYNSLRIGVSEVLRALTSESYRTNPEIVFDFKPSRQSGRRETNTVPKHKKRYFELLVVDSLFRRDEHLFREKLSKLRKDGDPFVYQPVFASSFQDSLIALTFNPNIQAVVIRYSVPFKSKQTNGVLKPFIGDTLKYKDDDNYEGDLGVWLGGVIKMIRPELDLYYVTDTSVHNLDDSVLTVFKRIFYQREDLQELHLTIVRGIKDRYETPFYSALKEYSQKPTGVFHAMPFSRGNSVFKSNWIDDFGEFYGRNLFLAETSSTTGGLDSLLQPTGPLKKAQEQAAQTFGSRKTFFATNGTSTSNKIVLQALVAPGDVVLIDRDCHKSHHYGMVLSGAYVTYLDSYPLQPYSMYGAVPLSGIKERLLTLKNAGRLDRVKMLLLTNCTFDGLVYNVERVMEEVLAIKPDMVFLWDEAWFAYAGFTYTFRQRTAMFVADKLLKKYRSPAYKEQYESHLQQIKKEGKSSPSLPNPELVKIRVYATQSTHKTLSSFRQGSMIHVYDEEFDRKVEESFQEAYMTHTSTSANYQILASLDICRRQLSFEGNELVEKSIEMAMLLRATVNDHPTLRKYFKVLTIEDIVPDKYRQSGLNEYYHSEKGWQRLEEAWEDDEFVLDPTKITLHIGNTGVDGDTFKNRYLMDQFNIQVNKTSRNTVLFMTNIGTTRSSVSYLISVLLKIAHQLDQEIDSLNPEETRIMQDKVYSLTAQSPPLPDFSHFHDSFRAVAGIPGGNMREAYFLAYDESKCEYARLSECATIMDSKRLIVSASFVIPYPPGFPVLVPGQVMTKEILDFLLALDVKEIHGYRPELGLRIFTESALNRHRTGTAMAGAVGGTIGYGKIKRKVVAGSSSKN